MRRKNGIGDVDVELLCQAIVDDAPDVAIVWEDRGAIVFANASGERLLGYEPGTLVGRSWLDLVHHEDQERLRAAMDEAASLSGRFGPIEHRVACGDGRWSTMQSAGSCRRDLAPAPVWILFSRDITERKFIEAQFRLAQRMAIVGRISAAAAHDFNSFLVAAVGYANQLLERRPTPRVARIATDLNQSAERTAALTRRLLRFARGGAELGPPVSNVNDVVIELSGLLERLVGERIVLNVRADAPSPRIAMNRSLVEQVIVNLVVNLRETQSGTGSLTVATRNEPPVAAGTEPGDVIIEIAAGRSNVTGAPSEPSSDAGLGLTAALGIVQEAGARLELDTERGRATRYRVIVPAMA